MDNEELLQIIELLAADLAAQTKRIDNIINKQKAEAFTKPKQQRNYSNNKTFINPFIKEK